MQDTIIQKLKDSIPLNKNEMIFLFNSNNSQLNTHILNAAYNKKIKNLGKVVYFRGLIELSNMCINDCFYCGIRKSNHTIHRFQMHFKDILDAAVWAYKKNYASIVIQAGERKDEEFVDFISKILDAINKETNGNLRITLSLGEQTKETYKTWFEKGAKRYLLRIETSNKNLYKKIHPEYQHFDNRKQCLTDLKNLGYQVGTGVMIGFPGQTNLDLVNDILFFKDIEIDMIGMGPYLPHKDTPLTIKNKHINGNLELSLKMIALTRLYLDDINIAATTALQVLAHDGREKAIMAGANVIMPNLSDIKYKSNYQLYDNKPCLDENASQCMGCLENRINKLGEHIAYGKFGDSSYFLKRSKK